MNKSIRLALCGIITAFSVMLMFLTGLIPVGTYALPGLAGMLLIIIVIEYGAGWAWPVYVATAILSVLIAPDKEAALAYVLLFGYYPILKSLIERLRKSFPITLFMKLIVFNAATVSEYFLAMWVLKIPQDSFEIFGASVPAAFLVLANISFFLYDYALSGLVVMYCKKYHSMVNRWLHLK